MNRDVIFPEMQAQIQTILPSLAYEKWCVSSRPALTQTHHFPVEMTQLEEENSKSSHTGCSPA